MVSRDVCNDETDKNSNNNNTITKDVNTKISDITNSTSVSHKHVHFKPQATKRSSFSSKVKTACVMLVGAMATSFPTVILNNNVQYMGDC